jgi:imidazolonepropionase-like amidohydrolase
MRAAYVMRAAAAGLMAASVVAFPIGAPDTIAIVNGRVFPVSGPPVEGATVLITDGKIAAVGAGILVPQGARRVDAKGAWVTPGLIDAATALGLVEVGAVKDSNDTTAKGQHAVAAAFRAWEGLNPDSVLWTPTRQEGVTSVIVLPSGGLIAGQAAAIDLATGGLDDMLRRAPVAMVAQVGSAGEAEASARGEVLLRLRELVEDARVYAERRQAYESAGTRAFAASRLDLEALVPVIEGRLPLVVSANRASEIDAVIRMSRDTKIRPIVIGGAEAWKLADALAAAHVPVMTSALDNIPSSFATLGARQENAAILRRAGVQTIIIGVAGESFNVRNIRQEAGNAVAYGLAWNEALRAVTLAPAEAFGLDQDVGSLQPGRDANVVVWSGDPFEFATQATHVFVRGREISERSRQDMLTDRYKKLPPAYIR